MSCPICGRVACNRYMHRIEDQDRYEAACDLSAEPRKIMEALADKDAEIEKLREIQAALVDAAEWSKALCEEIGHPETNAYAAACHALKLAGK